MNAEASMKNHRLLDDIETPEGCMWKGTYGICTLALSMLRRTSLRECRPTFMLSSSLFVSDLPSTDIRIHIEATLCVYRNAFPGFLNGVAAEVCIHNVLMLVQL